MAAFLGSLVAGHTPSPLTLPVFLRDPDGYVNHVAKILEAADPALVLADPSPGRPADAGDGEGPHRRHAGALRGQR